MASLILRFAGQQAWGVQATHDYRPTERIPTRRGVLGFLAAAQGLRVGSEELAGFHAAAAAYDIYARVDRPGTVFYDFHTVNANRDADVVRARAGVAKQTAKHETPIRKADGEPSPHPLVTRRGYLAGAEFIVAVESDSDEIDRLLRAVRNPRFSWYLGRKNCAPAFPVVLGRREGGAAEVLAELPSFADSGMLSLHHIVGDRSNKQVLVNPPRTTCLTDWKTE